MEIRKLINISIKRNTQILNDITITKTKCKRFNQWSVKNKAISGLPIFSIPIKGKKTQEMYIITEIRANFTGYCRLPDKCYEKAV